MSSSLLKWASWIVVALAGGLMIAAMAHSGAAAGPSAVERGNDRPGNTRQGAAETLTLAWTQKFIRVGPGSSRDRWRCSVAMGGAVYFSTGFIESSARQRLATRTNKPPICRRTDREYFGFGFSLGF